MWNNPGFKEFVKHVCEHYHAREDDVTVMLLKEIGEYENDKWAVGKALASAKHWLSDPWPEPIRPEHLAMYRPATLYFRMLKKKED